MISPGGFLFFFLVFFGFFFKIWFSGLVYRVKGWKMAQNEKKFCLSRSISQELYIIWFLFMVRMCKMIISPGIVFIFSKFSFPKLLGGKREKRVKNDKNFCLSHYISQEPYIIWLLFVKHQCKMIISPGAFFIFSKFEAQRAKMAKNDKKFCPSFLIYQEPHIIRSSFMVHMCKRIMSAGFFTFFPNFNFRGE